MFGHRAKSKNDEYIFYYNSKERWSWLIITFLLAFPICSRVVTVGKNYLLSGNFRVDIAFTFNTETILFLLLFLIVVGRTVYISSSYIEIRADGLLWVRGTIETFIPWSEIKMFDIRSGNTGHTIGLKLSRWVNPQSNNFLIRGMLSANFFPLHKFVDVPRSGQTIDTEKFRKSVIGAKLYEYAPQIFSIAYKF